MARFYVLAGLLLAGLTFGCKAQTPPAAPGSDLEHRIQLRVRSQYQLPPDVQVSIGRREPSKLVGYDNLPVTISRGSQTQEIDFLISTDNTRLAHLDTMDLTKSPEDGIDLAGRPVRGNPAAKVTVINFDDLECPFCGRMHRELFPATLDRYKDKIRFIYKDFPLTNIHPWAMHAAVDANCLAAQSGTVYWTYVDYLHDHGDEVNGADRTLAKSFDALDRIARQEATLGKLDGTKLDACLAKQDETAIKASQEEGEALNIDGTPALFVNGERINGALPRDQVWMVIDRALRAAGEEPPPPPSASLSAPAGTDPAGKQTVK